MTENFYSRLTEFDTGFYPIAAIEQKAKLLSRQNIQISAGNKDADFHTEDEVGQRCSEINQEALNWALKHSSDKAVDRYNKKGKKMIMGDDQGPYNAGPLWIWKYLGYNDNADHTTTTINSVMMRTPVDYGVKAAAGFHYCKLLSPFRAMEWIYNESLHEQDGISNTLSQKEQFIQ